MTIAIIPARGGSKRIPRKNIKLFRGKPIIQYSIQAAKDSGLFEHIVVSTDDSEIATIANQCGAETPFIRPQELADDYSDTVSVMVHGIKSCISLGWEFSFACCIYPCAPFIRVEDISNSLAAMNSVDAEFCFPLAHFQSPIQRALKIDGVGRISPFYPEFEATRTQDLSPAYYDAGQFYWGKTEAWLSGKPIHSHGLGFLIPSWRAVDIDTIDDWDRAEIMTAFV
jgi:pseudaminic acid cytidylyltransferase